MAKQDEIVWEFENYHTKSFYEELSLEENERNKEKFIKVIEKYIRTSMEYRNYIRYLRTEANLNFCDLYDRLPEDVIKSISIEMHHFPFTLYDLVEAVLNKYLVTKEVYTRLSIANEVMDLHYSKKVGLVPLTVTAHQLMHSAGYFVHKNDIFGNFHAFYQEYLPYLDDGQVGKYTKIVSTSKLSIEKSKQQFLEVRKDIFEEFDHNNFPTVMLPPIKDDERIDDADQNEEKMEFPSPDRKKKKKSNRKPIVIEEADDVDDMESDQDEPIISDIKPEKTNKNSKSLSDQFD